MNTISHIPFPQIDSVPRLIKDFLSGQLDRFEANRFSTENFSSQMELKQSQYPSAHREVLSEVLESQHSDFTLSQAQKDNLSAIKKANTFTVVTGHQLNLYTGPVFFIYKILQTIKTAAFLKEQFPDKNFVPVFWLASEDHDFEEINHFKTLNQYYEFKAISGDAVGRIKVEDQFFVHEFEKEFEHSVFGTELIRWIKQAYAIGNSLVEATKILVDCLFSDYGLLMLDGDDSRLKRLMIPTFKEELENKALFSHSKEDVAFLTERYGKVQVNPREINLFYLSGTRNRIQESPNGYEIVDSEKQFTREALLEELERYPERFSPNAVLRPVYQETVLPNLAYIGGNAEIMYWLELKSYFNHLKLSFPILIPRNSLLFLTEKTLKKIQRLELSVEDFFGNFAKVIERKFLADSPLEPLLQQQGARIDEGFEQLKQKANQTDKTFFNLVEAEQKRQGRSFKRMERRLLRAEKIKHREKLAQLEALFFEVHPGGIWQERVLNFSVFYSNLGRDWLQNCYLQMEVQKSGVNILTI